jgi:hypothetical protein
MQGWRDLELYRFDNFYAGLEKTRKYRLDNIDAGLEKYRLLQIN